MEEHRQDDLPSLLLGELPPGEAAALDRHLAGCDACRRDLAAVALASAALRDAARLPLRGRAGPRPRGEPALWRRRPRWLLTAVGALVITLLVVAVAVRSGGTSGRPVALAAPGGGLAAQAHLRGQGDAQVLTIDAGSLAPPPAGSVYEVWLLGAGGAALPVGVLAPSGHGIWSLPAAVAARFREIDVTVQAADGAPTRSARSVLRGSYAPVSR